VVLHKKSKLLGILNENYVNAGQSNH